MSIAVSIMSYLSARPSLPGSPCASRHGLFVPCRCDSVVRTCRPSSPRRRACQVRRTSVARQRDAVHWPTRARFFEPLPRLRGAHGGCCSASCDRLFAIGSTRPFQRWHNHPCRPCTSCLPAWPMRRAERTLFSHVGHRHFDWSVHILSLFRIPSYGS